MDYQEFKKRLENTLREILPEEISISFEKIPKNNGIYQEGMILSRIGENCAPVIYISDYFELFQKGVPLEQLAEKIYWAFENCGPRYRFTDQFFQNYEDLKTQIYFKLVNYEKNREQLKDIPHRRFLDLALIYYYRMEQTSPAATITIQNTHLNLWNITEEELWQNAWNYTRRKLPPKFVTMKEILGDEYPEDGGRSTVPMYILTNQERQFGAGVILYPNVLRRAALLLGENFYIIPSSIHECILVPSNSLYDKEELLEMVTEINQNQMDPLEVLADQVYCYSQKEGRILL